MLDLAGVRVRHILRYAELHEDLCDRFVPFVHPLRDLQTRGSQRDSAGVVDGDVSRLAQIFHHDADRRLRVPEFPAYIDGATISPAAQKHIDRLQIVFRRFMNNHIDTPIY